MNKPDKLRAFLAAAIPALAREPERLSMYVGKGRLRATGAARGDRQDLSFEYQYTLTVNLLDWTGGPDAVMVPLLAWVGANQVELVQSFDANRQGLSFEADILDAQTVDLAIEVSLTERVSVTARPGGGYDVVHLEEPPGDPGFGPWPDGQPDPVGLQQLHFKGERILGSPPEA